MITKTLVGSLRCLKAHWLLPLRFPKTFCTHYYRKHGRVGTWSTRLKGHRQCPLSCIFPLPCCYQYSQDVPRKFRLFHKVQMVFCGFHLYVENKIYSNSSNSNGNNQNNYNNYSDNSINMGLTHRAHSPVTIVLDDVVGLD